MSEEPEVRIFKIEFSISEYVPQDNGFYAIFQRGEVVRGTHDAMKVVSLILGEVESYFERRIANIRDDDDDENGKYANV